MSPIALIAGLALGVLAFCVGMMLGKRTGQREQAQTRASYDALKRDFAVVSAVNVELLTRAVAGDASHPGEDALDRFMDLYDGAKRCLHRALDRHNATAPRPLVITRDGANLLQVLADLPERGFSHDIGEDAGVRSWLKRVFEADAQRRVSGAPPSAEAVMALERERGLWSALAAPTRP